MALHTALAARVRSWLGNFAGGPIAGSSLPWIGDRINGTGGGVSVSAEGALSLASVYSACSVYSSIAALRWRIVRRMPDGAPERVDSDAARALLLAPYDDIEGGVFQCALTGNGYFRLQRNARGGVSGIELVAPWRVSLAVDDRGRRFYRIARCSFSGEDEEVLPAADVWHLKYRKAGGNHLIGTAPMASCSPAFAAALALRDTQRALLENTARPGTILATSKQLSQDQRDHLRDAWLEQAGGARQGKPVVLSSDLRPVELKTPSAADAQLLEGMRFSVLEVARVYNLPPSVLAQSDQTSFAAAVEETRAMVALALRPWAYRVADSLAAALLSEEERISGSEIEIDTSALTLGSGKELSESMSTLVNGGVITPNEARARLNLGPIAGGEQLGRPVNTLPADRWRDHVGNNVPPVKESL